MVWARIDTALSSSYNSFLISMLTGSKTDCGGEGSQARNPPGGRLKSALPLPFRRAAAVGMAGSGHSRRPEGGLCR